MGYLVNPSPSIANNKRITISLFSQILSGQGPVTGGYFNQFLCGPAVSESTFPFEFWIQPSTTPDKFLMGYDFTSSGVGPDSGVQLIQASNSPPTSYDTGVPTSFVDQYNVDLWNHTILAIDNSEAAPAVQKPGTDTYYQHQARLRVNNTDIALDSIASRFGIAPGSGSFDSPATYSADLILAGGPCYIPGPSIGSEGDPYIFGNLLMRIAHVNIFVGQYIDPDNADNMNSLISVVGDTISPRSPADVIAAFGVPTIQLYGGASDIATNRGTAGDFTKVGTVADIAGP